ncbi:MAG: ferritin-like domain-containing protein [Gaiellaceae bacterium]
MLAEALWIERMLAFELLPQLQREVDSEWLAGPIAQHLEQTRVHVDRVEAVIVAAGAEPTSAASAALEGLRHGHDELVEKIVEPRLKDVFLAGAAARTEHLEIALYTSLIGLAGRLGLDPGPLEQSLGDERQALREVEAAAEQLRERLPE